MNKQLVIIGITVLLITVGLSGCSNNQINTDKNKFVGSWSTVDGHAITTFFSDGSCSFPTVPLKQKYDIKDGKLVITFEGQFTFTYSYLFSNNDNTLTLTLNGQTNSTVFTRI